MDWDDDGYWEYMEERKRDWEERHGAIPVLSEDKKTIAYGLYPQTVVSNTALLNELSKLTTPESNGWYKYNEEYYVKLVARPYDSDCKFNNGTFIVEGKIYWFKCEPIIWNVLNHNFSKSFSPSSLSDVFFSSLMDALISTGRDLQGEYFLLSSLILDAYHYDGYSNDYEISDIRTWLNNEFYNSAFALNNRYIQTTTVDNSVATTNSKNNQYACVNTNDKVFLPSLKDYICDYGFTFESNESRECKTTDYARANGAWYSTDLSHLYNGWYWTRSPHSSHSDGAWNVGYNGTLGGNLVYADGSGVRPCINIKTK